MFSDPLISISSQELDFGVDETLLNFYVENTQDGTLDWTITESGDDQDAVTVSEASGSTLGGGAKSFFNRYGKQTRQ